MDYRFTGLDHVQLAAPRGCEAEARAFYGETLGMPEIAKPPLLQARWGVWFVCGAHQVHIGVQADFRPASKAHPALQIECLSALKARLTGLGVPVQDDEALEGADRFYVNDPFGNRLEFLEWKKPANG